MKPKTFKGVKAWAVLNWRTKEVKQVYTSKDYASYQASRAESFGLHLTPQDIYTIVPVLITPIQKPRKRKTTKRP